MQMKLKHFYNILATVYFISAPHVRTALDTNLFVHRTRVNLFCDHRTRVIQAGICCVQNWLQGRC